MDSKEIVRTAKTFADAITSQGLTKGEIVMCLAIVDTMVKERIGLQGQLPKAPSKPAKKAKKVTKKTPPKPNKKPGIKYDPLYDPPPPMSGDPLPPPDIPTGKVIGRKDSACICDGCHKVIYTIKQDIPDNCPVPQFIDSFKPFGDAPAITDKLEIQNIDGNISVDCPSCGGIKSLYLIGKGGPVAGSVG